MNIIPKNQTVKKNISVFLLTILTVFLAGTGYSEMRITTHNGKILTVPVNSQDIKTIEFTQEEAGLSIAGEWNSSIGFRYHIVQSGNTFTWNVTSPIHEQGKGTISDRNISASWNGTNGSGSASGRITGVDSSNRAKRIEWNNGVTFFR